jgi:transcription antitermination factor NusG
MEFTKSLNVKGVFGYLRFGSEYATIKEEEILKIKQFLKLEGISNVDSTSSLPVKGEIMRINTGALDGLTCKVLKINNRNKVFVRIESIRRNITAIVPPEYLSR